MELYWAIFFATLDVVLGYLAWRSHRRWVGLQRPAKVKRGKRNSMMLLGLGGAGKTTFVRDLFQDQRADATVTTEHYELYQTTTIIKRRNEQYTLFVGDYRGQNLGQLVSEFVTQQKEPFEPMSYGFINSLVLIVDLFPPSERSDHPALEPRSRADAGRVEMHNSQWNDTALDAVFGLLTAGSLKYVCLFVNKLDLLKGANTTPVQDDVENCFAELRDRLRLRAERAKADFQIVLGSAEESTGISRVREALFDRSVDGKRGRF